MGGNSARVLSTSEAFKREKMDDIKHKIRKLKADIQAKLNEYIRVLKIATKPDREEYSMAAKVTVAGTILIGTIGFIFYMAEQLIPQLV